MLDLVLVRLAPWVLLGLAAWFIAWFGVNVLRQLGQMALRLDEVSQRLEAIEQRATQAGAASPAARKSSKLPVGSTVPDFELPDLDGQRHAIADYRGRRLLLIFFSPRCGYCLKMAPDIAALPAEGGDGWPMPLVVTMGGLEENRRLMEQHGIRCPVLIQEQNEVAHDKYDIYGTPMGFLIDEEGKVMREAAAGADALMALALASKNEVSHRANELLGPPTGSAGETHKANKDLNDSRINRAGLKAGAAAPTFRLPRLDGNGEISLDEYRGRRLLLVFSDPDCKPCDQLAPHLERLYREKRDLAVLMISRREVDPNREKSAKLGLTLPVVLQRSWEVSLQYGIFATPVAYLIDDTGVIAADVAVGVDPIVELIARGTLQRGANRLLRVEQEVTA